MTTVYLNKQIKEIFENIKYRIDLFRFETILPIPGCVLLGSVLTNLDIFTIIIFVLISIGLLIATNSIAEVFDYYVDFINFHLLKKNFKSRSEPPIVKGKITKKSAILQGLMLYSICIFVSIFYFNSIPITAFILLIIFLAFIYIAPPFHLKKHGFLGVFDLTFLFSSLYLLPLFVNKTYLSSEEIVWFILLFSNTFIAMLCKDFKDYEGDAKLNIKSPVVLMGPKNIAKIVKYTTFLPLIFAIIYILKDRLLLPYIILSSVCFVPKIKYLKFMEKPVEYGEALASWGRIDRSIFPLVFAILLWIMAK